MVEYSVCFCDCCTRSYFAVVKLPSTRFLYGYDIIDLYWILFDYTKKLLNQRLKSHYEVFISIQFLFILFNLRYKTLPVSPTIKSPKRLRGNLLWYSFRCTRRSPKNDERYPLIKWWRVNHVSETPKNCSTFKTWRLLRNLARVQDVFYLKPSYPLPLNNRNLIIDVVLIIDGFKRVKMWLFKKEITCFFYSNPDQLDLLFFDDAQFPYQDDVSFPVEKDFH